MDLGEIQERLMKIVKIRVNSKGYELTTEQSFIHLVEEMGEVARQISHKAMRPEKFCNENLKEEIVDMLFECIVMAETCDMDLGVEIEKKLKKLEVRFPDSLITEK
jgi:NTP pyrophosphatase (non-canonical NTP hydrolase)